MKRPPLAFYTRLEGSEPEMRRQLGLPSGRLQILLLVGISRLEVSDITDSEVKQRRRHRSLREWNVMLGVKAGSALQ